MLRASARMDGRIDGRTDGRRNGWMEGRMDGWKGEETKGAERLRTAAEIPPPSPVRPCPECGSVGAPSPFSGPLSSRIRTARKMKSQRLGSEEDSPRVRVRALSGFGSDKKRKGKKK